MDIADVPNASLTAVRNGNKEEWLALFDENAVVEDPVGSAPWDTPVGTPRGKEAIGWYWDTFKKWHEAFEFDIHYQTTGGLEAATYASLHSTLADGTRRTVECINIYEINNDGLIVSLRSYHGR